MVKIILLIVIISLYVLIPFLLLIRRKTLIKKLEERSSVEELKQNIKWRKRWSIVMLIFLGISIVHTRDYDTISFASLHLMWFLLVYFFTLYTLIIIKPYIKEKEQKIE
jgi:hypothetical protein